MYLGWGCLHWPHLKVAGNVAIGGGGYEEQGFAIEKWLKYKHLSWKSFTFDELKHCSLLATSWHFSYSPHPPHLPRPKPPTTQPSVLGCSLLSPAPFYAHLPAVQASLQWSWVLVFLPQSMGICHWCWDTQGRLESIVTSRLADAQSCNRELI